MMIDKFEVGEEYADRAAVEYEVIYGNAEAPCVMVEPGQAASKQWKLGGVEVVKERKDLARLHFLPICFWEVLQIHLAQGPCDAGWISTTAFSRCQITWKIYSQC
jgi:hypothetical protein